MTSQGRWTGRWYEWPCTTCKSVCTSIDPPTADDANCAACRAAKDLSGLAKRIKALTTDRDDWQARALSAEKRAAEQEDLIFELQQMLARAS